MAETALTKTVALGSYQSDITTLTMIAADTVNQNSFIASGKDLVILHNTGAAQRTVTITSVADPSYGRSGDVSAVTIEIGEYCIFGPMKLPGWENTDGLILIESNHAEVKIGVVTLP